MHAHGATIVREGHGTGEGHGTSPGEVHDIALKVAETDATKRALATFGKPFGLEPIGAAGQQHPKSPYPHRLLSLGLLSPCPPMPASASIRTTLPLSHDRPATMVVVRIW